MNGFKNRRLLNELYPGIDFCCGKVHILCETPSQDMLVVVYKNGYSVDLGFVAKDRQYIVTVLKNDDWTKPVLQLISSDKSLMFKNLKASLRYAKKLSLRLS